jgi:amino acid adenylation domain-containing protein
MAPETRALTQAGVEAEKMGGGQMTTDGYGLHHLLDAAAQRWPDRVAVESTAGDPISYRQLVALSDRVRDRLAHWGVQRGDRVGVYVSKSIDALAAIFGVLKVGAAYVPVDPTAPAERNAYILSDCAVSAAIVEQQVCEQLQAAMSQNGAVPPILQLVNPGDGSALDAALQEQDRDVPAAAVPSVVAAPDDLAYILYTSGSTGKPKGVMLSHRNAISFVAWCSQVLAPNEHDRFSSHAPFHFDPSILDFYTPIKHGATLVLVSHGLGKDPVKLAAFIAERRLTVWYSTPSVLSLLVQYGELPQYDYSSLRILLFAGEVFPIKHLRALRQQISHPRYLNLYGPTETNVCTFYELTDSIDSGRADPYPIGKTCSHLESKVVDEHGHEVPSQSEGELCIRGPHVTNGYWNLPQQTEAAFLTDELGQDWYRTGDLVVADEQGDFVFRGRRDRMVKKRGYRVELGEIEACLYRHPKIRQAAVIALAGEQGVTIKAFISTHGGERLSIIALKTFCSKHLPVYMVPDAFSRHDTLPTTSTDKIAYEALKELA